MTNISKAYRPILTAVSLLLPLAAYSAAPAVHPNLDKRLAAIAAAADQHQEVRLMSTALDRQTLHLNSPFEPRWNAEGQVQVYLHYDRDGAAPRTQDLLDLGARDMKVSRALSVIQAWLPAASLDAVAATPGVTRVSVPRYGITKRAPATGPVDYVGSVTTEGDQILGAAAFRSATNYSGQGITVGVISDGDEHKSTSQSTKDLPNTVWDDPNDKGGSGGFSAPSSGDEGTAMMEIVHDLAPSASLGFCGPQTTVDFLTCLDDFAADLKANIIVDDLGFPGGAMFTTDTFTAGVQSFASDHPHIRLVTAAGNDGRGYWQGTYSTPTPVSVSKTVNGVSYTHAVNFGSSGSPSADLHIQVQPGDTVLYIVEWGDPWDDSATANDPNDYDVVLFDGSNHAVACNQGINISSGTACDQTNSKSLHTPGPTPVQGDAWTNPSKSSVANVHLEMFKVAGSPDDHIKILIASTTSQEVVISPNTPGSVYGHSALAYPTETTAGAIYAPDALSAVYNIESYSSQGPVEFGIGSTTSITKPDFAAPDCVRVTGAGSFPSTFCGTSAAAPHLAGTIALLMSAYPGKSAYTLMQQTAIQPGSPNPNGTFGHGIPDLQAVLAANVPNPLATITLPTRDVAVKPGTRVPFEGDCNFEGETSGTSLDWNFGSGSGIADSTSATPSVTFKDQGVFTTTLSCTSSVGTGKGTVKVTVSDPPTAKITKPASGTSVAVGSSVSFAGSCDFHAVKSDTSIDWDFDRNKSNLPDSSSANTAVKFSAAGTYNVTLSCTDALGVDSASVKIVVTAPSSGGGGGTVGLMSLLTLGLTFIRRKHLMR